MRKLEDCSKYNNEPYCRHQKGLYKKRQENWEVDYSFYLHNENWNYNFENEDSVVGCEQSFLSQMIFGHLFKVQGFNDFSINRNYIYAQHSDHRNLFFHYDVMNNPKIKHCLGKKNYFRF